MRFILFSSLRVVGTKREAKGTPKSPLLMGIALASRARKRKLKMLHYNRCEHCVCVCVCVCVCKVANSCDTTKQWALKDAEKFALFCPAVIPV